MNPRQLIARNLLHFWKRNLLLALGVAISTAVLTGALIVGDSVKYSLDEIVSQRLGDVNLMMQAGDRYFTGSLVEKFGDNSDASCAGVLVTDGIAVADGGRKRLEGMHIYGVDRHFDAVGGLSDFYGELQGDSVIISSNLAERLNLSSGDDFLLRMTKTSLVPSNAPFVSDADNIVSTRVTVKAVASAAEFGAFNTKNSQTAPFNVFIQAGRLQEIMDFNDRYNLLLLADLGLELADFRTQIEYAWSVEDAGLDLRYDTEGGFLDVKSERVFIDNPTRKALSRVAESAEPYLTYFVNSIESRSGQTPYSFVSTLPGAVLQDDEILINEWLANDLAARIGDSLMLEFFVVGPLRELEVDSAMFIIKDVQPIISYPADRFLMPDIPGMSDAGNCRDWDTGVPISLDDIRDKDEDYWTRYKGTPKAFISLSKAQQLWSNRFGSLTSFRYQLTSDEAAHLKNEIPLALTPGDLGFEFKEVLAEGRSSAAEGVDFSELFGGLSFFLLAGAIILSALLARLNLEDARKQISTLTALGIPLRITRRMQMTEFWLIAGIGALAGIALAFLYTRMVFTGLNGIWMDIVRANTLFVHFSATTLVSGYLASLAISGIAFLVVLQRFLKKMFSRHIKGEKLKKRSSGRWFAGTGLLSGLLAIVLIAIQLVQKEHYAPSVFFMSGGLLLIAGILLSLALLNAGAGKETEGLDLWSLAIKNAATNKTRSISILLLLALGTFLVISTGSNKKDLFVNASDQGSGTGGFLYYAESTIPVLSDLNSDAVRYENGISAEMNVVQMRAAEGDDASCLNLNRISSPRILGVPPESMKHRFNFETALEVVNEEEPWSALEIELEENLIPAIADQTVIKWSLGLNVGDTLIYSNARGEEMKLLLMAGTLPSVFQGSVLISDRNFLKHFPAASGTSVFLISGSLSDTAVIREDLSAAFRDYGWSLEYAPARLAEFNSVTNTYLSIFMILGALGLLLGTIALSIVLFRSMIERQPELALYRSLGFPVRKIKLLVIYEYMYLFLAGTLIGSVAALVATLPSFISANTGASFLMVVVIITVLLLNGFLWIVGMTRVALNMKSLNSSLRND